MGKAFRLFIWPLAALLLFLSCATSPNAYFQIDEGVRAGAYESALTSIEKETGKARKYIYNKKTDILLYLDRGMVKHYAGLYKESSEDLQTAEILIEEAFTKSITEAIGSFLLNDYTKEYPGEDYEDLYINVFNSLNYYHRNDLEGALVEIRRLNEKLNYLADRYERAKKRATESGNNIDTNQLPMEASRFSNSALARYLGILFFRGTGRPDDARIDYEELQRAYSLAPDVYTHPPPSSLEDELSIPEGMGRLNIIAFTGLSPVKQEERIMIPLLLPPPNHITTIAIPVMVARPQVVQRAEAVLDTGESFPLELLENMGAVAYETFKSRRALVIFKTVARTITKSVAGAAAEVAVAKTTDDAGLGVLVGFIGRIFTELSEQADTRLSRYFPRQALVGGINLPPGNYGVTVNFYGAGGLLYSEKSKIQVRERGVNLAEFSCLR